MEFEVTCSVCSDVLFHENEVVSTNCRHVFHGNCLTQWMQRSKTCPECRGFLKDQPVRLYFRSEPKASFYKEREEMYQTQVIDLKNEIEEQKKRYEEQLQAEVQIREIMHNKIKQLESEKGNGFANITDNNIGPEHIPIKVEPHCTFGNDTLVKPSSFANSFSSYMNNEQFENEIESITKSSDYMSMPIKVEPSCTVGNVEAPLFANNSPSYESYYMGSSPSYMNTNTGMFGSRTKRVNPYYSDYSPMSIEVEPRSFNDEDEAGGETSVKTPSYDVYPASSSYSNDPSTSNVQTPTQAVYKSSDSDDLYDF